MILLALALALQAEVPVDHAGSEVTVIGERLKNWRGKFTDDKRGVRCRTTRSSGDAAIDAIGCDAMSACWNASREQFMAAQAKELAADDRKRRGAAVNQAFGACTSDRRTSGIAVLAEERARARGL